MSVSHQQRFVLMDRHAAWSAFERGGPEVRTKHWIASISGLALGTPAAIEFEPGRRNACTDIGISGP